MPTDQHAQSPDEPEPPPCDCAGCQEFRAIHAGFCAELPDRERREKRINDRAAQIRWNDAHPETVHHFPPHRLAS